MNCSLELGIENSNGIKTTKWQQRIKLIASLMVNWKIRFHKKCYL